MSCLGRSERGLLVILSMDDIDFDLSCFDLSDTPDSSRESPYELGAEIDWLAAVTTALRTPMPEPMPRERAPRSSYSGFDDESVTGEHIRAASEPSTVD